MKTYIRRVNYCNNIRHTFMNLAPVMIFKHDTKNLSGGDLSGMQPEQQ